MKQSKTVIKKPIVGEIVEVTHHPNADRLYIAKVNVGGTDLVTVVFAGKKMLKPHDLVPIALPGTKLASGEKVRARTYRKVRSYAELLSKDELLGTTGGPDETFIVSPQKFSVGDVVTPDKLE